MHMMVGLLSSMAIVSVKRPARDRWRAEFRLGPFAWEYADQALWVSIVMGYPPELDGWFHGKYHEKWMMTGGSRILGHLHLVLLGLLMERTMVVTHWNLTPITLYGFGWPSFYLTVWLRHDPFIDDQLDDLAMRNGDGREFGDSESSVVTHS